MAEAYLGIRVTACFNFHKWWNVVALFQYIHPFLRYESRLVGEPCCLCECVSMLEMRVQKDLELSSSSYVTYFIYEVIRLITPKVLPCPRQIDCCQCFFQLWKPIMEPLFGVTFRSTGKFSFVSMESDHHYFMWISAWGTGKSLHLLDAVSGVVVAGLYYPLLLENPKLSVICALEHSWGGASLSLPSMIWASSSVWIIVSASRLQKKTLLNCHL